MMDLQVAIFLLIFLSLSSLATIGICFVEIRSCWRQYRLRVETQRLRKMNIIVDESEECIVENVVDKDLVLEAALEPSTGTTATILAMEPNHYNHFNHDQFSEQDYETFPYHHSHHSVQNVPELYHHQAMFSPNIEEVFSSNNHQHHLIYASSHAAQRFQQRGMGAFV